MALKRGQLETLTMTTVLKISFETEMESVYHTLLWEDSTSLYCCILTRLCLNNVKSPAVDETLYESALGGISDFFSSHDGVTT